MAELVEAVGKTHQRPLGENTSIYTVSCNFHFLVNGHSVLVNHKVTPFARTTEGEVWLALCLVSPSVHSDTGHIEATVSSPSGYSVYTFENHCWKKRKKQLVLTEGERTMLHLSAQGYTMSQIGDTVHMTKFFLDIFFKRLFVC